MSAFTDAAASGMATMMAAAWAVAQAASANGEDWETQGRRFKKLAQD